MHIITKQGEEYNYAINLTFKATNKEAKYEELLVGCRGDPGLYYWPHSLEDVENFAKKCPRCQEHTPVSRFSPEEMISITFLWPFVQWRLDLISPFLMARESETFMVVVVDYLTKWVEARALETIIASAIMKFLWQSIVW